MGKKHDKKGFHARKDPSTSPENRDAYSNQMQPEGFVPLSEIVHPVIEAIEAAYSESETAVFDGLIKGSHLAVVSAPNRKLKTTFALTQAEYVALANKLCVGIFSLKWNRNIVVQRMLSAAAHLNSHSVRNGFLTTKNWSILRTVASWLSKSPIYIDDTQSLNILELCERSRQLSDNLAAKGKRLSLIVIDNMQLLMGAGKKVSKQDELRMLDSLRNLVATLGVAVIVLSQEPLRKASKILK